MHTFCKHCGFAQTVDSSFSCKKCGGSLKENKQNLLTEIDKEKEKAYKKLLTLNRLEKEIIETDGKK